MTVEILRVVEDNPLFSGLSGDLINDIVASASKKTLDSNETLFRKGDRANALWGVLSGRIVTQVTAEDGKELVLDVFEAGDVFGEVGVLDFGPRPVDAIADTRTELFRLARRQFLQHLQSSPELCFRIFSLLCRDLRETTEALEDTALYALPSRLAKKLVNLVKHKNQHATDDPLALNISHNELARWLGVHRVSVSRLLSQWEKAGILSSGRQRIEVRNFEALTELAAPGQSQVFGSRQWAAADFRESSSREFQEKDLSVGAGPSCGPGLRGILAIDAAEYSRSLAHDAAGTLKRIKAGMHAIDKAIADRDGRLISHSGDRVLADFPGVDKAFEAALAIHDRADGLGILGSRHAHSIFRIGIHYGEVRSGEDSYLGEAVNTAIRLTEFSGGGGICLSGQAREILGLPDIPELQFLGDHELKNVPGTVPVYSARSIPIFRMLALRVKTLVPRRFRPTAVVAALVLLLAGIWITGDRAGRQRALPAPAQLSIAVLPFATSGDPELDYLGGGIPEQIRAVLSTVPGMRVIGRESSGYFDDRTASIEEIAQTLGVGWLLLGNLESSGDQVNATTQLLNAANNEVVWEEQFLNSHGGFIGFAPEIVQHIAIALGIIDGDGAGLPQLVPLTHNSEAHALYIEAQSHMWRGRQRNVINAVPLLQKAVELEPSFAEAYAVLAALYLQVSLLDEQQAYNPDSRRELARQSLQKALSLKPDSPLVLAKAAQARAFDNDYQGALALAERALRIDPNNTEALKALYWTQLNQKDLVGTLRTAERLMRLEPLSVNAMHSYWTELFRADRHQEGLAVAKKALAFYPENEIPQAHAWAAASKLKLGDRLGAIESSRKGMPYGSPYDLWTGLEHDWELSDDLDPLRSAVGLVYVEEYDQVRQLLIDHWDAADPDSAGANSLDYLVNRGELEAMAGDVEASARYFEKAQLLAPDEKGGLVSAPVWYQVLDWSRQSHWSVAALFAFRKSGRHEQAAIIAEQFEEMIADNIARLATVSHVADYQYLYMEAQYHAIEGHSNEALDKLRTWLEYGVDIFTYIQWDPFLENLRGDPEFEAIVAGVEAELANIRAQYHANQAGLPEMGRE